MASPLFQVLILPIILMLVGVMARRLGRRDNDDSPRRNDWAVGTTVLLMMIGVVLADFRAPQADVTSLPSWLGGLLLLTFLSLDHDRYRSWERDPNGHPDKQKRVIFGIVLPDIIALAVFGAYQAGKIALI